MNETVFTLAHQLAILLESEVQEEKTVSVHHYFSRLGVLQGSFPDYPGDSDKYDRLCSEINSSLSSTQKIYLLLLIQDALLALNDDHVFNKNIRTVYERIGVDTGLIDKFSIFFRQENIFGITSSEYLLISPQDAVDNEMLEGRWIEDNVPRGRAVSGNFTLNQIKGHLLVMFIDSIRSYVVRCIDNHERVFDQDTMLYCRFRLLKPGTELSIDGVPVLTFSDIKSRFLQLNEKRELTFAIDRVQYVNNQGVKEMHSLTSRETTGQLIGIVGREGVGKSTLLKLLAGKFKPTSGSITINGYDLWKNKYLLKGIIGFIPEEDLLLEDLTVADNLSLTARLYYSNLSKKEIDDKVNALLSRIDLIEIKHVVVGKPDNKMIQPGQRRLINIALELLREPQILLVDNALSGLGMSDANKVIKVLHDYSFSGNLVITSISQVDSETFLLFDKIWILDQGGYPVYNGPVKSASAYLLKNLKLNYPGNEITDPAQLLDWLNYRLPDKEAHVWKRVNEPQSWHNIYLREQALHDSGIVARTRLPARILKIPNLEVQLLIFSIRNFKCKFSKLNEIIKALVIGPIAAMVLGWLFHTSDGGVYTYFANKNIPVYQFVSVVLAIFLGLSASIDEIIRERNILEKEEYQEFSRFSYLNSKILYLFPVLAVQTLLYVITGNFILGIKGMFAVYWLVMFSAACFGALLGLAVSAAVKSRHSLYKAVIPVVIGLQLLLGGGLISFERLNLGDHRYTPFLGDLMVSRWGYEALAVEQFKNNAYEKLVYPTEKKLDQASFYFFHAVPEMEKAFASCFSENKDTVRSNLAFLKHEMERASEISGALPFEYLNQIPDMLKKEELAQEVNGYLSTYLTSYFSDQYDTMKKAKSALMKHLSDSIGAGNLKEMMISFHNVALEQVVENRQSEKAYRIIDNSIVRNTGMIYDIPASSWGRAALFSPLKIFQDKQTETLWFNLAVIWLFTSICYIWVLFDFSGAFSRAFRLNKR